MKPMRILLAAGAANLSLLTALPLTPLAAQDTGEAMAEDVMLADETATTGQEDEMAAMTEMFAGLFTAEPLTPEQEARLPAAQALIAKVIPEGTMGEMMDKMMSGVLGPMMAMAPGGANATLAKQIGLTPFGLEDDQAAELASLFDAAWQERQQRELAMFPALMKEVMVVMEPGMRKAMSELYAIRFSGGELAEIDAFFTTGTGGKYARESFLMASDPRIMASTMEALPAVMGMMGDIETRMAASVADLPPVRSFAELTPAERAKVAEATGYSIEEIESGLAVGSEGFEAAAEAMEEASEEAGEATEAAE